MNRLGLSLQTEALLAPHAVALGLDSQSATMDDSPLQVLTVATAPYPDQRHGSGGLRRMVYVFQTRKHYLHNFIQSIFSSIDLRDRQGSTVVVGGDGRFFNQTAITVVVQMAAANGVSVPVSVCVCLFLHVVCLCLRAHFFWGGDNKGSGIIYSQIKRF